MAVLNSAARTLLEGPALGHLVTLNPDGSPQVTCVWVGLDGDEIVCAHRSHHVKVRNIKRDSRVALSIESEHVDERGMKEYLVVYGHARVTEGGVYELLERLARVYWGPNGPPPGLLRTDTSPTSRSTVSAASAPGGRARGARPLEHETPHAQGLLPETAGFRVFAAFRAFVLQMS